MAKAARMRKLALSTTPTSPLKPATRRISAIRHRVIGISDVPDLGSPDTMTIECGLSTVANHNLVLSIRLGQIEEDDDRRIADGGVMAGEVEAAGFAIHPEDGDVVAALIAAIEELARWGRS